jgi:hypothetical protein
VGPSRDGAPGTAPAPGPGDATTDGAYQPVQSSWYFVIVGEGSWALSAHDGNKCLAVYFVGG